jgi:hypothetical protein
MWKNSHVVLFNMFDRKDDNNPVNLGVPSFKTRPHEGFSSLKQHPNCAIDRQLPTTVEGLLASAPRIAKLKSGRISTMARTATCPWSTFGENQAAPEYHWHPPTIIIYLFVVQWLYLDDFEIRPRPDLKCIVY